ncbi:MAG TPA: DUF6498-containing protein [Thermoanaerobaculia bacterium]|nr:DUF6498-containing protein [Thermoanaerobaculia bacterium]
MVDRARGLVALLGINAIPLAGVFLGGWSGATALSLYWWENLFGCLLVLARLLLHRRWTRKRGYERLHLTLASRDNEGKPLQQWKPGVRPKVERKGNFVQEFAVAALAATAVHGLLLWFAVAKVLEGSPDGAALRQAVLGVGAVQAAVFLWDLRGLSERPFAWVRDQAQNTLNRVTLIHLFLIVGTWVALKSETITFFGPFAVIKAMADVGNLLARGGVNLDGPEAPGWLAATINRLSPGRDFAEYWRELKGEERRLAAQDEQSRR